MTPQIFFRSQPFAGSPDSGSLLGEALANPTIEKVTFVVAWARYGGLARLESEINAFRARGGFLRIILGVDLDAATVPGLLLAGKLSDEAYVFHDQGGGTFHPKVYLAEGSEEAVLLVGSSNLTAGGLYGNFESSLEARFALPEDAGEPALLDARTFIESLVRDFEACKPLDANLIAAMLLDNRLKVSRTEGNTTKRSADTRGTDPVFGRSALRTVSMPRLRRAPGSDSDKIGEAEQGELGEREPAEAEPVASDDSQSVERDRRKGPGIVRRWFKANLKKSDSQQLPTSSPSAALTLVQAGHSLDRQTYFRDEFFGDLEWSESGGKQVAEIVAQVTVGGEFKGEKNMLVVHDPAFDSEQNNRTTLLRWGEFQTYLRDNDLTGTTVSLERTSDGHFLVTFADEATGDFVW